MMRPLHDRLIVKRSDQATRTASGIIIPESQNEKPEQGKVIAIGNGKIYENGFVREIDVKVGDTILFGKFAGQTIKSDSEDFLVMLEDDVLAVFQEVDIAVVVE